MKFGCRLVLIGALILLAAVYSSEGGRRRTGGSSRKKSSSSWFSRKKTKTNPNPESSYPRQQYSPVNNNNRPSSNPNPESSYPRQQYSPVNNNNRPSSNPNPKSSYPRQQYSPVNNNNNRPSVVNTQGQRNNYGQQPNTGTGSIGGGGFVNPNPNTGGGGSIGGGGFVNPNTNKGGTNYGGTNYGGTNYGGTNRGTNYGGTNYGGTNYGGTNRGTNYGGNYYGGSSGFGRTNYGYYGGGVFNKPSSGGIFGGGGKRAFGLGVGAGFLGGAVAGVAAMEVYHRYKMYQSMMHYKMGMGGYGYGYGNQYGMGGYGGGHRRGMLLDEFDCMGGCPRDAFCDYGMCRCRNGFDAQYGNCWKRLDDFNARQAEWDQRLQPGFNPNTPCGTHAECQRIDMNMVCDQPSKICTCRPDMKWNVDVLECQIFMDVNCTDVNLTQEQPRVASSKGNDTTTAQSNGNDTTSVQANDSDTTSAQSNGTVQEEEGSFDDSGIYPTNSSDPVNITTLTANETLSNSELTRIDVNKTSTEDIKQAFCRDISSVSRRYESQRFQANNRNNVQRVPTEEGSIGAGVIALIVILIIIMACCGCIFVCFKKIRTMGSSRFNGPKDDTDVPMDNYQQPPPPPGYPQPNDMMGPEQPTMYPMMPDQSQQQPYPNQGAYPYPPNPGVPYAPNNAPPYPIEGNQSVYPPQQPVYPPQPPYNPSA